MIICFRGVILFITLTLQRYSYRVPFYRWESWSSQKLAQGPTEGKRKVENEATICWPQSLSFSSPARLVPPFLPGSGPGDVSILRMGVTMSSEMILFPNRLSKEQKWTVFPTFLYLPSFPICIREHVHACTRTHTQSSWNNRLQRD